MRILLVTARPPWPSRRGDQARAAGWIEALGGRHRLRVLALRPPGFPPPLEPPATPATTRIVEHGRRAMLRGLCAHPRLPLQVALHHSTDLARAFAAELAEHRPEVVVAILSRVGWVVERAGDVPVVVDLVDSLELNLRRRARRQPLLAPLWRWEARRVGRWERRLARVAAASCVVGELDRDAIAGGDPELAARIMVVPFGLPVPDRSPVPTATAPADPEVVLLSGNLGYFPTVDAAGWFGREVWPRIRAARPRVEWWLAGSRPAAAVRRLARLPGVRLLAEPDDLAAIRRRARLAVVPLHAGSGTPIKILEAMADGLPVVTTAAGRAGLDRIDPAAVAVADSPDAFAAAVLGLLADPAAAAAQARAAHAWVRRRHALPAVAAVFEALLVRAAAR